MTEHKASRTLVKSPPELWAECSDATALTRHLDQFGEIKITRLEPETAVAWEGEHVRGTVRLEPSGWGTKVTLTAERVGVEGVAEPDPVPEPERPVASEPEPVEPEPEPEAVAEPEPVAMIEPAPEPEPEPAEPPVAASPPKRRGFFARLFRRRGPVSEPVPEPTIQLEPVPVVVAEPEPVALAEPGPEPEPVAVTEPGPEPEPVAVTEPGPEPEPDAVTEPEPESPSQPDSDPEVRASEPSISAELADAETALAAALDSLGQAHHRPFSRA